MADKELTPEVTVFIAEDSIDTVATNIEDVRTVATHLFDLKNVSSSMSSILTVTEQVRAAEAAKVAAAQDALRAEKAAAKAETVTEIVIATDTRVGIVKPDMTTIRVSADGTLSTIAKAPNPATSTTIGLVKPDNTTIVIDGSGTISVNQEKLVAKYS